MTTNHASLQPVSGAVLESITAVREAVFKLLSEIETAPECALTAAAVTAAQTAANELGTVEVLLSRWPLSARY